MATTADVSLGSYIRHNNDICQIIEWQHRTPGNLRAFYQGKMRNLRNGKLNEHRWRSGEVIEVLRIEINYEVRATNSRFNLVYPFYLEQ